jgi:hypothetical protein
VRKAGLHVSMGFDGHRMEDYKVERVEKANNFLDQNNLLNAVKLLKKKC